MKVTADKLLDEISPDFQFYLKQGNLTSFANFDSNLNIENIEKLLKIHFVLSRTSDNGIGVIDFIRELPDRIRRVKTIIKQEPRAYYGVVKGRIKWNETFNHRYNKEPCNTAVYVCDQIEKNYDISENLVLKNILKIIYEIVNNDLKFAIDNNYSWMNDWITDPDNLKDELNTTFLNNIYLKRINTGGEKITERMLFRALTSRMPLYREAAELQIRYNKLMRYEIDAEEAKKLLNNTFIKPDRTDELFELYWTIKILKQFKNPIFKIIEPNNNLVAEWSENGYIYRIYHNSIGSLNFSENITDIMQRYSNDDNFIGRKLRAQNQTIMMASINSFWIGGRPDILLEKYDINNKLLSVLICEVKYTNNKDYALVGLKQLIEYIALAKSSDEYLEQRDQLFQNLKIIRGCLFIGEAEGLNIIDHDKIKVIKYGDDISQLKNFFVNNDPWKRDIFC